MPFVLLDFLEKYKKPVLLLFSGTLHEDYLRELLTTLGDRFSQEDVDDLYKVVWFLGNQLLKLFFEI